MDVRVRVEGANVDVQDELRSLARWVRDEEILGVGARRTSPPPGEGEMGALSDILVVFGPGGAGAALGVALTNWLQTRRPNLAMTVTRADGTNMTYSTSGAKYAEKALEVFLQEAFQSDGTPTEPGLGKQASGE